MLKKIIFVLIAVLLTASCGSKSANGDSSGNAPAAPAEQTYSTIDVFGIVKPQEIRSVNFGFNCKILKLLIRDGQVTGKGEQLLKLDLGTIMLDISTREQLYKQSAMDLELLKDEYEKNLRLKKEKAISRKQLDESCTAWKKKASELEMREMEYSLYKSRIDTDLLQDDYLVCPMDNAVISAFNSEEGNFISQNTRIMNLINLDSLVIEANVPEEFINDITIGAKAQVTPLSNRKKTCNGIVSFIAHGAKNENGETIVPVIITLEEKDPSLLPYFNVDIKINKSSEKQQG